MRFTTNPMLMQQPVDQRDWLAWGRELDRLLIGGEFEQFTVGDTTPSVKNGRFFYTANTGAITITAFDDGYTGQVITVKFTLAPPNTIIDFTGTTLKGNVGVDWTPGNGDFMNCTFDGTNWLCAITRTV